MDNIKNQIIDEYTWHYKIEAESYRMMGRLLDEDLVNKRLELCGVKDIYIYGGTYLAVQLYRAVVNKVKVKGIVDKAGRLAVRICVPILCIDELKNLYKDEKIIITPPRFYQEIKEELSHFICPSNILFLGEFLEGFI